MSTEWEVKAEKVARAQRTYFRADSFIEDLRKNTVRDGFLMSESAFHEMIAAMQQDRELAKRVNDFAVVLLMSAESKREIGDLLVFAEMYLNG